MDMEKIKSALDQPFDPFNLGILSENSAGDLAGELLVDVYQDEKNIYVKSAIAGVEPEDIEINFSAGVLTLQGERSEKEKIEKDDYFCQECYWGKFSKSISLPAPVDEEKISAELRDGVLKITLPKILSKKAVAVKIKNN